MRLPQLQLVDTASAIGFAMSNDNNTSWWKDSRWQIGTGQALVAAIAIAVAVGGIILYATTTANPEKTIAFGGMIAAAALVAGSVIGFLFALPRSVSISTGQEKAEELSNITVRPNTNLEEVSDWITKIIVGLTLTQLGKIPGAASHLFYVLGQSLGTPPESTIFAGCIVTYSSIVGLVNGWLTTRIYISQWMRETDTPLRAATVAAMQATADQPATDQAAAGSPATDQAAAGSPAAGSPAAGSPATDQAAAGSPAAGSPAGRPADVIRRAGNGQ
jgi:hypothetical protein